MKSNNGKILLGAMIAFVGGQIPNANKGFDRKKGTPKRGDMSFDECLKMAKDMEENNLEPKETNNGINKMLR